MDGFNSSSGIFGPALNELVDLSRETEDRMKVWFVQACTEEEGFAGFFHDRCADLRMSLSKNQRLIAELEAVGERGDTVRCLDHIREIVTRDTGKLGVLEQLLAGTHVGIRLKDSYVADMGKRSRVS
ncbi:hypothetical protein Tco_0736239 [Tanacetum coccineum]